MTQEEAFKEITENSLNNSWINPVFMGNCTEEFKRYFNIKVKDFRRIYTTTNVDIFGMTKDEDHYLINCRIKENSI